jgi:peptide/nickel transport system substrate-binding protein
MDRPSRALVLNGRKHGQEIIFSLKFCHTTSLLLLALLFLIACVEKPQTETPNGNEVESSSEETVGEGTGGHVAGEPENIKENVAEPKQDGPAELQEAASSTSTPPAQKEVVICMGGQPPDLFLYGDETLAATALRHAIYENLFTTVGYAYQAQGLEKMPSLADNDAVFKTVIVKEGDRLIDAAGNLVTLVDGVMVNSADGEVVKFDGTPIKMEQLVVDFSFQPMVWSDGTPVTAEDSAFSFRLAADPQIAFRSNGVTHTESYVVKGERTVRWTGLPGLKDQTYFENVWSPLPSHQLADIPIDDLKHAEETNKLPLSSGPFVVREWVSENELVMDRNPHYYLQNEGLPAVNRLIVRFGNGEDFLAGDPAETCDILADGALRAGNLPLLEMAAEKGNWEVLTVPGDVFEHIAFGVNPVEEYAERRPDWFEDVQVRQALTMCTDRQRMIQELTDGRAELLHAYVPASHPMFPDDLEEWEYDLEGANALLDEAGYLDFSEDGRRQDVNSGVPMTITLGTNSESSLRLRITEIFQENMVDCGIAVERYDLPAGSWYAEGPIGRWFVRRFDLAEFAWLARPLPDCGLYFSANITGPEEFGFGGWQNANVTGWSSDEFDAACGEALHSLPGGVGYKEKQQESLRIFARELPAIPLFTNLKVAAVRPELQNIVLDSSQPSLLWNISQWDVEE